MNEGQILDIINKLTLESLSNEERSLVVANVVAETSNKRMAGSIFKIVLSKLEEMNNGDYDIKDSFQNFDADEKIPEPMSVINMDSIEDFIEKMISTKDDPSYFSDTFDFYHPTENMKADGVPRTRSDFNTK
jgi:hypothetical protein